jgi:hypothetical protein
MRRRAAAPFYFFPRAFFEALIDALAGQFAFVHAVAGGEVVSSELILCSEERAYMFLSGTRADAFPLYPNDAVRHRAFAWGLSQGKRAFVLGGGFEPEDGVFRHKRVFAPHGIVPFEVACLVHDAAACDELVRQRARAATAVEPWSPRPRFFPPYRG